MSVETDSAKISKIERLLNLVAFLLSVDEPIPFHQIRGRVVGYDDPASPDALEKRFDRDKADLRGMGIPIQFTATDALGRSGYYIPKDQYYLAEIDFTVEEAMVLTILTHLVSGDARDSLGANLRSALQKVTIDSQIPDAIRANVAEQHLFHLNLAPGKGSVARNVATLQTALRKRRAVRFTYHAMGPDETRDREIEPWGLGFARADWYLIGHCRSRKAERMFRVSRIKGSVRPIPRETIDRPPADFDMRTRLARETWEYGTGEPIEVTIRIVPDEAWMFREGLKAGQTFAEQADGSGRLTLFATEPEQVIRWIAKRGAGATIVEPAWLRERAREWFRTTREHHR